MEPSGIRAAQAEESRPDQLKTYFCHISLELFFDFSAEELEVLRRNLLLPTDYYVRHCIYLLIADHT